MRRLTVRSWLQVSAPAVKDYDSLFDEDDEDFLNRDFIEPQSSPKTNEDEEDNHMVASGHPRNRGAIIEDDENSLG